MGIRDFQYRVDDIRDVLFRRFKLLICLHAESGNSKQESTSSSLYIKSFSILYFANLQIATNT